MSYSGKFKDKNNNLHPVTSVLYGTCDTAAATAAKVVTCADFDTLMTGVTIRVKFTNANTAASPTVNINSTGAKSVYRYGSTTPVDGDSWTAGEVVELLYDGTSFFMVGADDLSVKQNATDNSLETTAKTIVGAINEHEGDIVSLKSGLTNLDTEVNGDATTYDFADVITIEDAVPANVADCSVKIEPAQDLHGQSAPYVGGAGKNKLPMTVDGIKALNTLGMWSGNTYSLNNVSFTILVDNADNVTGISINASSAASDTTRFDLCEASNNSDCILNGCPSGGSQDSYRMTYSGVATDSGSGVEIPANSSGAVYIRIASGYTPNNVVFYPMLRLATETDATFAPYTNYCPISGHTQASVQRDGKNQWDIDNSQSGYINENGEVTSHDYLKASSYIRVSPNESYTLSYYRINNPSYFEKGMRVAWYDANKNFIQRDGVLEETTSGLKAYTCVSPSNAYYARVSCPFKTSNYYNQQFELSSSATPYEPFKGKTYTIALGDTIYGGTVDFDSGVMTVDRVIAQFNGSDSTRWERRAAYGTSTCFDYNGLSVEPNALASYGIANYLTLGTIGTNDLECFNFHATTKVLQVQLHTDRLATDDVTGLMTYLSSNPLQVCYKIATPFTVQLTAQQIQLLQGQNTIYASTGQISVTVNGVSGSIGSVQEQVNATDESLAELAADIVEQLPTAPTTDGAYVLTVTVSSGTPTYSWESAT